MKYTKVSVDAFAEMQLNAGILASDFNPATGALDANDILGATTGGVSATCAPTIVDFGEDVDNVPVGTKQLQKITGYEPRISGTFLTVVANTLKMIVGAAELNSVSTPKVTPRHDLKDADFADVWFIGDYSDKNGNSNGGFIAIHLINAFNTDGFAIRTNKDGKGNFAVNFRGFYDLDDPDNVPMEFYIKAGTDEPGGFALSFVSAASANNVGKTAISGVSPAKTTGQSYVYQTGYELRMIHEGDVLLGSAWTAWNGTDEITATTGMDIIIATITTSTGVAVHGGKSIVVSKEE